MTGRSSRQWGTALGRQRACIWEALEPLQIKHKYMPVGSDLGLTLIICILAFVFNT